MPATSGRIRPKPEIHEQRPGRGEPTEQVFQMSGSIFTPTGAHWSAAGWVFRNILDRTALVLIGRGNAALGSLLAEGGVVRVVQTLDLSDLRASDRQDFQQALKVAYQWFETEGPENWRRPEFFPGFMDCFSELLRVLTTEAA